MIIDTLTYQLAEKEKHNEKLECEIVGLRKDLEKTKSPNLRFAKGSETFNKIIKVQHYPLIKTGLGYTEEASQSQKSSTSTKSYLDATKNNEQYNNRQQRHKVDHQVNQAQFASRMNKIHNQPQVKHTEFDSKMNINRNYNHQNVWIGLLKHKDEAFEKFKAFKDLVENESDRKIKCLIFDRGGEFTSDEFFDFCEQHGIKRQFSTARTPPKNGVVERMNRIVQQMARAMLDESGTLATFWGATAFTIVTILNQENVRVNSTQTPHELWYDADWAGSVDDRKSTSGGAFYMGSKLVSWFSKKQSSIALSTAEAEYVATTSCCTQLLWMMQTLQDIQITGTPPISILCDNTSAISISKNPVMHSKTKHIPIKYHFLHE
eukprot:PITA_33923